MSAERGRPDVPRYRPVSARRRVLLLLLAVGTATTVILLMLNPAMRAGRLRLQAAADAVPAAAQAEPAVCSAGQTSGCVGGTATVIVVPLAASTTGTAIAPAAR